MSGVELELRVAWQRHLGASPVAIEWFDAVLGALPGSRAGTTTACATSLGSSATSQAIAADHPVDDLDAAVAAAFFHDAVYDPTQHDNEAESARDRRTRTAARSVGRTGAAGTSATS